jgi:hypothetical protein
MEDYEPIDANQATTMWLDDVLGNFLMKKMLLVIKFLVVITIFLIR